jgi:dCMP deaminase
MSIPTWNQYFTQLANLVKTKSKDRSGHVGAVIVGDNHHVLSTGYNGFPRCIDDTVDAYHERPLKYDMTCHAEHNAILQAAYHGIKLEGADIYVTTQYVCAECCKAIIQAGLKRVFAPDAPMELKGTHWQRSCVIGRNMLLEAGVEVWLLDSQGRSSLVTWRSKVPK